MTGQTEIFSNGNSGNNVETLDALFALLDREPLDRTFEPECYGNFIMVDPVNVRGEALLPPGGVSFFGNFFNWSHVFNIHTTDPDLIDRLTKAIRANQQRPDYLAQDDEVETKRKAEARRRERDAVRSAERKRVLERELAHINRLEAAE